MSNRITDWHKAVKIEMIRRGLSYADLETALGIGRTHLSAVINGRINSERAMGLLSNYLNIPNGDLIIKVDYIPK